MTEIQNVSGLARDIAHPDCDVTVDVDETVDVPKHVADALLEQTSVWARPRGRRKNTTSKPDGQDAPDGTDLHEEDDR